MAKRKTAKQREKESSFIRSRVAREAAEGKGETRSTVIHSRVIHGAASVESGSAKPTRNKAKRSRSPRPSGNKKTTRATRTTTTPTET